MDSRRSRNICRCPRSTTRFSSTFLFLSWILPTSSFAQLTSSLPTMNIPSPTTLSTSTVPSSSTSPSNPPIAFTQPTLPPASSTSMTADQVGEHAFNYYFLIVAFIVVIFCLCILWCGRRKKRKAALMRRQSQRALARDVEGWRTRFRARVESVEDRVEGLDERGEAPPPYVPGTKPPSIRTEDGRRIVVGQSSGAGEVVELSRMSSEIANNPPGYHEADSRGDDEDIGDITRPRSAVTASDRFGSMRRFLSDTRGST